MDATSPKPEDQAGRWVWFIDMLFAAIIAIALNKYEPVVREAWAAGMGPFALSVLVAIGVGSFFVYDVAVYHILVNKHPYRISFLGFARFYLDLVMVFILFMLLADALQRAPSWPSIIVTISAWHLAAALWHLLARVEEHDFSGARKAILPHFLFVAIYWGLAWAFRFVDRYVVALDEQSRSTGILAVLSVTIFTISLIRWNQVIKQYKGNG